MLHFARFLTALAVITAVAVPAGARMLFVPGGSIAVSSHPRFVVVDDLDQDGLADAVVVSRRKKVAVLFGSETAVTAFEQPTVLSFGRRLRRPNTGDTNGDGLIDIVIPDDGQRGLWILIARADRTFLPPQFVGTTFRPRAVAVADLDGVGGDDIVAGERRKGVGRVFLNGTSGRRLGPFVSFPPGLTRLECVDLNGDGRNEIIGLSANRDGVSVSAITPTNDEGTAYEDVGVVRAAAKKADMAIADIDSNGTKDIALLAQTRRRSSTNIRLALVRRDNSFEPTITVESPCLAQRYGRFCRTRGLAMADFDGDGVPDLATGLRNQSTFGAFGARRSGIVSLLRGRGDTFVSDSTAPWLDRVPTGLATGDFNGDGRIDIITISRTGSSLQVLKNLSSPDVREVRQRPDLPPRR